MPELPEVETIARSLDKRVAGDVIESVWIGSKPEPLKSPAREIAKVAPEVPVLLCTAHLSIDLLGEAQKIGIQGAVSKSRAGDIVNGIKALLRHELFFCQPAEI